MERTVDRSAVRFAETAPPPCGSDSSRWDWRAGRSREARSPVVQRGGGRGGRSDGHPHRAGAGLELSQAICGGVRIDGQTAEKGPVHVVVRTARRDELVAVLRVKAPPRSGGPARPRWSRWRYRWGSWGLACLQVVSGGFGR